MTIPTSGTRAAVMRPPRRASCSCTQKGTIYGARRTCSSRTTTRRRSASGSARTRPTSRRTSCLTWAVSGYRVTWPGRYAREFVTRPQGGLALRSRARAPAPAPARATAGRSRRTTPTPTPPATAARAGVGTVLSYLTWEPENPAERAAAQQLQNRSRARRRTGGPGSRSHTNTFCYCGRRGPTIAATGPARRTCLVYPGRAVSSVF